MWRPKNWVNKFRAEADRLEKRWDNGDDKHHPYIPMLFKEAYDQKNAFEAGADAMLEALTESGIKMDNYQPLNRTVMETAAFLNQCKDGILVFIPDEEE